MQQPSAPSDLSPQNFSLKKFHIFWKTVHFLAQARKTEKSTPGKQNSLILIQKISYISGKGKPKTFLIFPEVNFRAQKNKKKFTSKKIPYISRNGTFWLALILENLQKRKPRKRILILQEMGTLKKLLIFWEM